VSQYGLEASGVLDYLNSPNGKIAMDTVLSQFGLSKSFLKTGITLLGQSKAEGMVIEQLAGDKFDTAMSALPADDAAYIKQVPEAVLAESLVDAIAGTKPAASSGGQVSNPLANLLNNGGLATPS
jgi:hypothetical protein